MQAIAMYDNVSKQSNSKTFSIKMDDRLALHLLINEYICEISIYTEAGKPSEHH